MKNSAFLPSLIPLSVVVAHLDHLAGSPLATLVLSYL